MLTSLLFIFFNFLFEENKMEMKSLLSSVALDSAGHFSQIQCMQTGKVIQPDCFYSWAIFFFFGDGYGKSLMVAV